MGTPAAAAADVLVHACMHAMVSRKWVQSSHLVGELLEVLGHILHRDFVVHQLPARTCLI